ncbi:CoA transferase [Mycobacterium lepromatosis]
MLAYLDTEVMKIEATGNEAAHQITPVLSGSPPLTTYSLPNNRSKKSVTVDLTNDEARQHIL